jgi:hypothetical protein
LILFAECIFSLHERGGLLAGAMHAPYSVMYGPCDCEHVLIGRVYDRLHDE